MKNLFCRNNKTSNKLFIFMRMSFIVVIACIVYLLILSSYEASANPLLNGKIIDLPWEILFNNKLFDALVIHYYDKTFAEKNLQNYVLGISFFFLNNYDRAEYHLMQIDIPRFSYRYDAKEFYLGIVNFLKKDYSKAAEYFNLIAEYEDTITEYGKFIYYFSLSLIEIKLYDAALSYLNKGLDSKEEYYKPYYAFTIGKAYYNLQDYGNAAIQFERFLLKYADSSLMDDTIFYLGRAYDQLKNVKNAKKEYTLIIDYYKNSEYYFHSLYYIGKITGNAIYYEEIIKKNPEFDKIDFVAYYLGKLNYELKKSDEALQYFDFCLTHTKDSTLLYNCLYWLIKLEKPIDPKYIPMLDDADKLNILKYMLNIYYREKNYTKIEEIIRDYPTLLDDNCFYIIGKTYLEKKEFDQALLWFIKAHETNYTEGKYPYYIGYVYYLKNLMDESFTMFSNALKAKKISSEYKITSMVYLGLIHVKNNNLDKAKDLFSTIITEYPSYQKIPEVLYFISVVEYNQKQFKSALNHIKQAYSMKNIPEDVRNLVIRHYAIVSIRFDSKEAERLYNEYVNLYSDKKQLFVLTLKFADFYFSSQNYASAMEYYTKAEKLTSNNEQFVDIVLKKISIYYNNNENTIGYREVQNLYKNNYSHKKSDVLYYCVLFAIRVSQPYDRYLAELKTANNKELYLAAVSIVLADLLKKEMNVKAINLIDSVLQYIDDPQLKQRMEMKKIELLLVLKRYTEAEGIINKLKDYEGTEYQTDIETARLLIAKMKKDYSTLKNLIVAKCNESNFHLLVQLYILDKISENEMVTIHKESIDKAVLDAYNAFVIFLSNKSSSDVLKNLRKYAGSSHNFISFWAKFFIGYSLYLQNDEKNSSKLFESLLTYELPADLEIVYYLLGKIEKKNEKGMHYWNTFIKQYPNSILPLQ